MAVYELAQLPASAITRFWKYVDVRGPDDCWEWTGSRNGQGYGHLGVLGKLSKSHKLALSISGQPPIPGMMTLHSCDNPPCCNPAHLRYGTAKENMADRNDRGRMPDYRGARNPSAKLTFEEAAIIRASTELGRVLAKRFNVSEAQISKVRLGKTFKEVPIAGVSFRHRRGPGRHIAKLKVS